jgi:diguanylate cyclase (GGDEF)-like protein
MLEPLLAVHSAQSEAWLADAAATAAERGLGALYGLLYLKDASGQLRGERPASTERVRALARVNQALDETVAALSFDPDTLPAAREALAEGRAKAVDSLAAALPVAAGDAAQRKLGVAEVWLAPLHWDGESAGLLLLLMPPAHSATLELAELLGRHVAVALKNLREEEEGRKRGELDPVRWINDERRFTEQLDLEIQRAQRHERPLSILLARLEDYPGIRARLGRFLAERLLRQVGGAMEVAMRTTDFLGAFQVDGFAAILIEADAAASERAKDRLLTALSGLSLAPANLPHVDLRLACATASVPDDGTTPSELIAAAGSKLEQAMAERPEPADEAKEQEDEVA